MLKALDTSNSQSRNLLAAPLGRRKEEGNVPTVDFNIFISARQLLINSSCLFHRSMMIGAHPSSLCERCLPNKSHQSLILPLVLYQTVFKLPLEISHIESIIGISTPIPCSQLLQLMNFCYHHVYSSVPLTPWADCLHLAYKSTNPLLFSLSLPFSSRLCLAFQGSSQCCVGRHLQPQGLRCPAEEPGGTAGPQSCCG